MYSCRSLVDISPQGEPFENFAKCLSLDNTLLNTSIFPYLPVIHLTASTFL